MCDVFLFKNSSNVFLTIRPNIDEFPELIDALFCWEIMRRTFTVFFPESTRVVLEVNLNVQHARADFVIQRINITEKLRPSMAAAAAAVTFVEVISNEINDDGCGKRFRVLMFE